MKLSITLSKFSLKSEKNIQKKNYKFKNLFKGQAKQFLSLEEFGMQYSM